MDEILAECMAGRCHECRTYEERIATICTDAIAYFEQLEINNLTEGFEVLSLESPRPDPPTLPRLVVFDIDGTALDDRKKGRKPNGELRRHEPVFKLYLKLIELKYKIIFLTGRLPILGKAEETIKNLTDEGYSIMADLILCSPSVERAPQAIAVWKDLEREKLTHKYILIAVIGDQPMDTEGQHIGQKQFRLPDPPRHQLQQQNGCTIQ